MPGKVADVILIIALLALPMLGIIQACGGNGPIAPGRPVDTPEDDDEPVLPGDNHAPTAVLSVVGPEEGATPFTVHLDGSGSFDPDGDPLEYLWIFSDGGSATESIVEHEFVSSGRYDVTLVVTDPHDASDDEGPLTLYSWGLANSPWPKFAHDERNSGVAQFEGPMMDLENADDGGAWSRYWRSGNEDNLVYGICIGYDGMVVYTQGEWLRAKTADGGYLWDFEAESLISAWPAIAHDGSIIIGTDAGRMHRIDADGNLIWSTNFDAEIGRGLHLWSAVNIDSNGTIYVGGIQYTTGYQSSVHEGKLIAVTLNGNLRWVGDLGEHHFTTGFAYPQAVERIVPAITPSGNIVVNGKPARLFSPDGSLVTELDYRIGTATATVGPPSVNPEGVIVAGYGRCPMFTPTGEYHMDLFGELLYFSSSGQGYAGWMQSPVFGSDGICQVQRFYQGGDEIILATRTANGRLHTLDLLTLEYEPIDEYLENITIAGATEDAYGRIYASCLGIHAISPIRYQSVFPYAPKRFSLWTYSKEGGHFMTPPVIGNDRWLYVGYGNDIMAVGD